MSMLLGCAALDITPPVGTPMAGSLRPRASVGVEDPLLCKAMVLQSGDIGVALITLDLIGWTRARSDEPRAIIAAQAGIPSEHILVNCSHTHSGPYTDESLDLSGCLDETYLARVQAAMAAAALLAAENLVPVSVGTARARVSGIGGNRRLLRPNGDAINVWLATEDERQNLAPAGPSDDDLIAWVFFSHGRPVATLWNYTLHVNAHFGTSFSADYPGRVANALERSFGPGFFSLFLPGACGDINSVVSFDQVHRRLSAAMEELVRQAAPGDCEVLGASWREVRVAVRDREPFQEAEVRAKWPDCFDVFQNEDRLLQAAPEDEITAVVQALRIGDGAIAATPGELFAQLGLNIKQRSPYPVTAVAELCNDIIGYIPTREAFQQGGYETFRSRWARVAPGSGERLVDELVSMLQAGPGAPAGPGYHGAAA